MKAKFKYLILLWSSFFLVYLAHGQAVDLSFNSGLGAKDIVYAIELLDDGKIIVGGTINNDDIDTSKPRNIARLNPDGSLDYSFESGTGFNGVVKTIEIQEDGKILVGGRFTEYNGEAVNKLVRLNSDGTLDEDFEISHPFINSNWLEVSEILLSADGSFFIGGTGWNSWQPVSAMLRKLNADGTLDGNFQASGDFYTSIFSMDVQSDGKILLVGQISSFSNYNQPLGVLRLHNDGTIDTSFKLSNTRYKLTKIKVQNDNKVLVGGHFLDYDGQDYRNLVRLEESGEIDESFEIGEGFYSRSSSGIGAGPLGGVNDIDFDAEGRILVSGSFLRYKEHPVYGIVRLNPNGGLESTFTSCGVYREEATEINQSVILPDGRVISGGGISEFDGITGINGMIKLTGDESAYPSPIVDFDVILVGRKASFVNNTRHAFDYQWNFGRSWATDSGSNPVYTYESPGQYTVTLTGKGFCGEEVTVSKEISVFGVSNIHPKKGGNQGLVTMSLSGMGFTEQTQVRLLKGGQEIIGTTSYASEMGDEIQVYFDLTGKELGEWNLDVRNGGLRLEAKEAFEIENVIAPEIHAEFVGRNQIRAGRQERLIVRYSNTGNVDALMVPLTLQYPSNVEVELFDSLKLIKNIAEIVGLEDFMEDTVSLSKTYGDLAYLPLIIPVIPANSSGEIEFLYGAETASEFNISIITNTPSLENVSQGFSDSRVLADDCNLTYAGMGLAAAGVGVAVVGSSLPIAACIAGIVSTKLSTDLSISSWSRANNTKDYILAGASYALVIAEGVISGAACAAALGATVPAVLSSGITGGILLGAGVILTGIDILQNPQCFEGVKTLATSTIQVFTAFDPNEKVGPSNITEDNYKQGRAPFTYTIFFENLDSATAAAQEVIILDTLDSDLLDLSTFQLSGYGYGAEKYSVPVGLSGYSQVNPLQRSFGDAMNVRFDGMLDPESAVVKWRFLSIDPATGELIDDPIDGFLPPNKVPGEGEGYVTFSVQPKEGLLTGTRIENKALIYFDFNEPIVTNTFVNTIDKTTPESGVLALPAVSTDTVFTVSWSGEDAHAGIRSYDVLVSVNEGEYGIWQYDVPHTSADFTGHADSVYRFYSIAKDYAGNKEVNKTQFEAETKIVIQKFAITGISTTVPTCSGMVNGTATIAISNAGADLEYSLDNQNFQDANYFENLNPGDYTVYVRDKADSLNTEEASFTIGAAIYETPPVPTISIEGQDGVSQELSLVSSSATNNQWLRDGEEIPGATGQSILVTESGTYQVIVTGEGSCSAISDIVAITSVPEIKTLDIKLHPNPAENVTSLHFGKETYVAKIMIYSSAGVFLRELVPEMAVSQIEIDLYGLAPGTYIIEIEGEGIFERLRFIKQ